MLSLYFETLVLAMHLCFGFWRYFKIQTSFRTLISKKTTISQLKESQSNNKRLQKTMTSSYQMK